MMIPCDTIPNDSTVDRAEDTEYCQDLSRQTTKTIEADRSEKGTTACTIYQVNAVFRSKINYTILPVHLTVVDF